VSKSQVRLSLQIAAIAFLTCTGALRICAQTPPHAEFEVATLKASPPLTGDLININLGTVRNGKVILSNASLSDCLKLAYGVVSDEQISGPDWIKSKAVRFDVVGQAAPDTSLDQLQLMLQTLLAERLKLVLHHEQKAIRHLALVVGKNGPKLVESKTAPASLTPAVRGHIQSDQMTMQRLATLLSRFERQTVVDKTGLKGAYEVKLDWTSDQAAVDGLGAQTSGPSLFTAVQEQLGLRLESERGLLDVLVIDKAEQTPAAN
jgi:uncharacterized protein (TIGR03435 family)